MWMLLGPRAWSERMRRTPKAAALATLTEDSSITAEDAATCASAMLA